MTADYEDLGNLSAVEPWHIRSMSCDNCKVSWGGCWDNFQCPKCGGGEIPKPSALEDLPTLPDNKNE